MRITVLGGSGAWPVAGGACGGYLVRWADYRLLIDPGFGSLGHLLGHTRAEDVDAVLVSHGHPDHCADINPLLRARTLSTSPPDRLTVAAPHGALDAILALDEPGFLDDSHRLAEFTPGDAFRLGPFQIQSVALPHSVDNAGFRISAGGRHLAYTGDRGPDPRMVDLASGADVLLAEATFPEEVPARHRGNLSSARDAAVEATSAGVGHLVLTHLWPGTAHRRAYEAAVPYFRGPISVAQPTMELDLGSADHAS
ncbi:MBL fold metallo-hydrolase [Spiractinospora alimapuensis]|uniref:MBL fold metallo-hydrolase n=1 Tax=Spiractinospora alimapuensis TaxID=2820884 RepID=UPI001F1C6A38|nr:MBL fold metallo-hydrolase [Spiractinospora alimapuensis]QVQ54415.1 MBL fold metallo-hydrolase [Spiractinospora alimapuensis]